MKKLLIVGAGGFGRSVAEASLAGANLRVVGFVDDRWPDIEPIWDLPVFGRIGDLCNLRAHADAVIIAIGENRTRQAVCLKACALGFDQAIVVHPHAWVSPTARIGQGTMVMAGAIVGTEASIGDGVIIGAAAVVDHHAKLGHFAHIGIGGRMAGGSELGAGAWMQEGTVLGPLQKLGPEQIIHRAQA